MSRNSSHQKKDVAQIEAYKKTIRGLKSESTISRPDMFSDSDSYESKVEDSVKSGRRSRPIGSVIKEHVLDNFVQYVIGLFSILFGFLAIEAKVDIGKLFEHQQGTDKRIDEMHQDLKEQNDKLIGDEFKLQELRLRSESRDNNKQ